MALSILHWLSIAGAIGNKQQLTFEFRLLISLLFSGQSFGSAIVTDVNPRSIGYGGGAVTINGEGFSEDVFNQFDPVLGNKVFTIILNLF